MFTADGATLDRSTRGTTDSGSYREMVGGWWCRRCFFGCMMHPPNRIKSRVRMMHVPNSFYQRTLLGCSVSVTSYCISRILCSIFDFRMPNVYRHASKRNIHTHVMCGDTLMQSSWGLVNLMCVCVWFINKRQRVETDMHAVDKTAVPKTGFSMQRMQRLTDEKVFVERSTQPSTAKFVRLMINRQTIQSEFLPAGLLDSWI